MEDSGGGLRSVTLSRDTPIGRAGTVPVGPREPIEILDSVIGYVDFSRTEASNVDLIIERLRYRLTETSEQQEIVVFAKVKGELNTADAHRNVDCEMCD